MKLDEVQISQFRNLHYVTIKPSLSVNLIQGENGSGKSSLLEAIHYLGFGRSFRTSKHKSVIQNDCDKFSVFAKCTSDSQNGGAQKLGLSFSRNKEFQINLDGVHSNRLTELVKRVPVQIFTPQSSDLVLGSPGFRRKYIDWGLFHVEHSYLEQSQSYRKLLKHKNALLKSNRLSELNDVNYWNRQLIEAGLEVDKQRTNYISSLEPILKAILSEFLPEFSFEISYNRGWERSTSLEDAVNAKHDLDIKNGFLSVGPHKADLQIRTHSREVSEVLSRGQMRMLVAAMLLAQTRHLQQGQSKAGIFLLDDISAELDSDKRERFMNGLLESESQIFVTAIEKAQLGFLNKYNDKKVFHVKHGVVSEES